MSKAHFATLILGFLTIRHLVPHLHCILDACQQKAHATGRFALELDEKDK